MLVVHCLRGQQAILAFVTGSIKAGVPGMDGGEPWR
jgi:hypothetical protein